MPLLVAEAAKLSQEDLVRGVIEEIIDRDDLFALFPFTKTDGKAYVYNRENTLTEADFLSPYDTVAEGGATFTTITTTLKVIAGDVDLDKFLLATQSDENPQLAIQLAQKAKGVGRMFRRALIQGSVAGNAKSFDGLQALVTSGQTILAGTNGAALTLAMLDQLLDQVPHGADALVMRRSTWRAVRALLRAFNGNQAETVMVPNFGHPIPAYNGTPVLMNDFIPINEVAGSNSNTTSIYAARLNEVDGFHGIYGGPSAGVVVEEVGTVQTKDAVRYRMKWYVGTALKSTQSAARLSGLTNI
jgi:HK97 family phage major capsid protein